LEPKALKQNAVQTKYFENIFRTFLNSKQKN
jgi:hypothetical protein